MYPQPLPFFPLEFPLALCQHIVVVCIYCGADTKVTNSRLQKRSNQVWRRRQCQSCRAIFTTLEGIDLPSSLLVVKRGSEVPFLPDKLYTEVLLALQDRPDCYQAAREITNTGIKELLKLPDKPLFQAHQISEATSKVLKRFDRRGWLRYVAEHPSLQTSFEGKHQRSNTKNQTFNGGTA